MSGDPAAEDAEHRDDRVNRDQVHPTLLDVESARGLEVVRQPDQEEPPYWIGDEFRDDERPRLPVAQRPNPAHRTVARVLSRVAPDQVELGRGTSPPPFRP